jgi:hypothetical protein
MNLTMSFVFAALLVLIGAPRPLLNNNADTIVACAEAAGTLAFAEAMENLDDRLTGSFTLALAVTAPHCSLLPASGIYRMSDELNSIKEKYRIYKLNSTFLI